MQICGAHPTDATSDLPQRLDESRDCVFNLGTHPERHERANFVGQLGQASLRFSSTQPLQIRRAGRDLRHGILRVAQELANAWSTRIKRSLPKNILPSTKMVGEPKPPRSISSSVFCLSLSLYSCEAIFAKYSFSSRPAARTISRSTSSLLISRSSPQYCSKT